MHEDDTLEARSRAVLRKLSEVNQRVAARMLELAEVAPDAKDTLLSEADRLRSAAERIRHVATDTAQSEDTPA